MRLYKDKSDAAGYRGSQEITRIAVAVVAIQLFAVATCLAQGQGPSDAPLEGNLGDFSIGGGSSSGGSKHPRDTDNLALAMQWLAGPDKYEKYEFAQIYLALTGFTGDTAWRMVRKAFRQWNKVRYGTEYGVLSDENGVIGEAPKFEDFESDGLWREDPSEEYLKDLELYTKQYKNNRLIKNPEKRAADYAHWLETKRLYDRALRKWQESVDRAEERFNTSGEDEEIEKFFKWRDNSLAN